jgi:nicotinamidase-related amidase
MSDQNEAIIPHLGLLVLDVQASFLKVFTEPDPFVKRVAFCVETANLFGIPTLFTEQRPEVLGHTIEEIACLNPDSPRVSKTSFSAFNEPAIAEWIERNSIHHLLITGLETPVCVYQSALDALNQDLEVTLLCDAVGARRSEDAAAVLASLRIHGAHVLPAETIFYSILRDSKHPLFKEFTALVKKYSDK